MAALTFPYGTLKASGFRLDIVASVISGGVTPSGYQQRANTSGGGLWALNLDFNRFSTPDQIRAWRVIQYGGDGGVVPINVSICDLRQAPRPTTGQGGGVPHSDDTPFSDDSLYSSPWIVASLAANAPIRATTISASFEGDSAPLGGEFFSLPYGDGYHELHVIIGVVEAGGIYELRIRPPLRAAQVAGTAINFDHPTGTFVQATSESMAMATEYGRWGKATAAFVEYLGAL